MVCLKLIKKSTFLVQQQLEWEECFLNLEQIPASCCLEQMSMDPMILLAETFFFSNRWQQGQFHAKRRLMAILIGVSLCLPQ